MDSARSAEAQKTSAVGALWNLAVNNVENQNAIANACLLYTSPSPRDS